jgi:branched-chain amino acid transport system substrate-binding protein
MARSRTRRHVRGRRVAVAVAVLSLTAAACGDSSDDTASDGSSSGSAGGGIDRSLVLGSIEPMTGANILTQYINGVRMAVEDINAEGGIGGHPIELKEYDDAIDAQKTVAAVRLAVSDKVDVAIGMPSTIENNAGAPILDQAGIVHLNAGVSTPIAADEALGSDMTFRIMTPMPELIYADAQHVINELKPSKIAMMGLGIDYGKNALPLFRKHFEEAGIEVTAENLYPFDAKALTNEVLAAKGADAILDWSYPNQMALGIRTAEQQGLGDIPYIGGPSSSIVNSRSLVEAELQDGLVGAQSCDPRSDDREHVQEWAKRYEEKYDEPPDYASPSVYDAVFLLKKAVEEADSLDHEDIAAALKTVTYDENTMCATVYKSDDRNELSHEAVVMTFDGGTPKQAKHYTADDLEGKGPIQK